MLNTALTGKLILPILFVSLASPANLSDELSPVDRTEVCVTKGAISPESGTHLEITEPEVRAVLHHQTAQNVEAKFKYLGPTEKIKKLGSGEKRLQFGLKLKAANSCNLVYAMWRTEPKAELVVSVKINPHKSTHEQCGIRGYHTIQPKSASKVSSFQTGEHHTIRATLDNLHLRVWIDKERVWDGNLPRMALAFDGPVGIRSDNVKVQFELLALPPGAEKECKNKNEDE